MAKAGTIFGLLKVRGQIVGAEVAGFASLVMGYAGLSLFDPWARFAPFVHVLAFGLLLTLSFLTFARRLKGKPVPLPFPWVRLAFFGPFLLLGLYTAGGDSLRRIYVGLTPAYLTPAPSMWLDVTLTPPAYTGLKPVVLARHVETPSSILLTAKPVTVPAGSVITVTSQGPGFQPSLVWGRSAVTLRQAGQGNFRIAGKVEADTRVEIRLGSKRLAVWPLAVVPDHPPQARLVGLPRFTERRSLKLHIKATDDYGVSYLALKMNLKSDPDQPAKLVDLPASGLREVDEVEYPNLLSHPWAGKAVTARLVAVDGAGQAGESAPFEITLPAAQFHNALSQALMVVRKNVQDGGDGLRLASQRLGDLTQTADEANLDVTTYLGLRSAWSRLENDPSGEHKGEIADLLWDLAVRAEDGGLTNARDDLGQALDQLRLAVRHNAPADEVNAMLGHFSWALRGYDDNRRKAGMAAAGARSEDKTEGLDWPALTRFLNKEVDLVGKGNYARVAADLDALKEGLEERGDILLSAGAYRRFLIAGYALQTLDDVKNVQQQLLSQGARVAPALVRQRILADQRVLVQMSRQLAEAGIGHGALDAVARAMSDAATALARHNPAEAVRAQEQILAMLQKEAFVLAQVPSPVGKDWTGGAEDPLGRPLPGILTAHDAPSHPATAARE